MIINESTSIDNMRYALDTHLHVNNLMKPIGSASLNVYSHTQFMVGDVAASAATVDDEDLGGW